MGIANAEMCNRNWGYLPITRGRQDRNIRVVVGEFCVSSSQKQRERESLSHERGEREFGYFWEFRVRACVCVCVKGTHAANQASRRGEAASGGYNLVSQWESNLLIKGF